MRHALSSTILIGIVALAGCNATSNPVVGTWEGRATADEGDARAAVCRATCCPTVAPRLGLLTRSRGKGADRYLTVSKHSAQQEKRAKFMEIVHTKGVSLTALCHIVNKLAQDGEHISQQRLEGIARERFSQVRRAITLPLDGGGEHVWHVADFMLLVASTVRSSPAMEELFSNALQRSPCSPIFSMEVAGDLGRVHAKQPAEGAEPAQGHGGEHVAPRTGARAA